MQIKMLHIFCKDLMHGKIGIYGNLWIFGQNLLEKFFLNRKKVSQEGGAL